MTRPTVTLECITRDTLLNLAKELRGLTEGEVEPIEAAAIEVERYGLERACEEARDAADERNTCWHDEVAAILEAVRVNDPLDPNDCSECARSYGPRYTGPCEH